MARGGARPGAGRRKGSATRRTREIADKASEEGVTPLEVMLTAMRAHFDKKRYDEAAEIAKDAAPYMHPKLAPVGATDGSNGEDENNGPDIVIRGGLPDDD